RKPAEDRARARDRTGPRRPDRRPADTRRRCRCDRIHPQAPDRHARQGQGRAAHISRTRRDTIAFRPDPGDVCRPRGGRARARSDRGRAWPADGRRRRKGGRRMSTPYAKLPAWADYGLIPLINLIVAFFVAGLVVLLVGESPLRAAVILIKGAFGGGQNI